MLEIAHTRRLLAAALLWGASATLALAQEPPPELPEPVKLAQARGTALFEVHNYEAALAEFAAAYRLLDGYPQQYLVLSNLALCHERKFRYVQAIESYERYLAEGGARVDDRAEVEASIARLESLIATVSIDSNVPADVWVDDRKVGRAPGTVRVSPGRHLVELRANLYESARQALDVEAGAALERRFELSRLSQFSGLGPGYFWTFAGLTAATLAVGVGFGVHALNLDADGHARAGRDRLLNRIEDEAAVSRAASAADVLYASAAVLGASTIVLFFLTDWSAAPQERTPAPRIAPYANGTAWGLRAGGAL